MYRSHFLNITHTQKDLLSLLSLNYHFQILIQKLMFYHLIKTVLKVYYPIKIQLRNLLLNYNFVHFLSCKKALAFHNNDSNEDYLILDVLMQFLTKVKYYYYCFNHSYLIAPIGKVDFKD